MTFRRLVFLAWRNLWRSRRRTIITASTIAFGFAMAVFSIGLGDGGHNQMIRNGIRMGNGHLTIQPEGYLKAPANHVYLNDGAAFRLPGGVEGAKVAGEKAAGERVGGAVVGRDQANGAEVTLAPRIVLQVLASTARNALGAALQGIDVAADPFREILAPGVKQGRWLEPGDDRGILIGFKMAKRLKARVGSKIVILAGGGGGETASRLGRVRGIFEAGNDAVDSFVIFASLDLARQLLPAGAEGIRPAAVTRYAVFLSDPKRMEYWKGALREGGLPQGAVVLNWQEMMPDLVNFVLLDDFGNYVWLGIILVVVWFGILNTVLMSVLERTREFGLLRALGMRPRELVGLVVLETVLLAGISLAAGWAVGGGAHYYFSTVGLDLAGMYSSDALAVGGVMMDPVLKSELSWGRVFALTAVVFGATLFSGIYPAIKAARVSPISALAT